MIKKEAGLIQFILLILIAVGILVGVYLVQQQTNLKSKASATGVNLSLHPSQAIITDNQERTLSVFAQTSALFEVAAAEIYINFDPDKIEIKNIASSGTSLPVVLEPGAVSGNTASITLGATPPNLFNGNGEIATITYIPKDELTGSTTIQFTSNTVVAALNNIGNVVGSLNSVTITRSPGGSTGTLSASPATHTLVAGVLAKSTINATWADFSQYGVICVSENGEAQKLFASGRGSTGSISQETGDGSGWIQAPHTYTFYLYSVEDLENETYSSSCEGTPVATTIVRGILPASTSTSTPAANTFTSLSAQLTENNAAFNFSYPGLVSHFEVDMSSSPNFSSDIYYKFADGQTTSVSRVPNSLSAQYSSYICGTTLYWRVKAIVNTQTSATSDIQSATVSCP